jgi:hypothetical protein
LRQGRPEDAGHHHWYFEHCSSDRTYSFSRTDYGDLQLFDGNKWSTVPLNCVSSFAMGRNHCLAVCEEKLYYWERQQVRQVITLVALELFDQCCSRK